MNDNAVNPTGKVAISLNDEVKWIMGRPCFVLINTASMLRTKGYEIARKAEDEQAVSIFWMLQLYQEYGDSWRDEAQKALDEWNKSKSG